MKKTFSILLALLMTLCLSACGAPAQDAPVEADGQHFTVTLTNETKEQLKSIGLTCCIDGEAVCSTGMEAADGSLLGSGEIEMPIYESDLGTAKLQHFSLVISVTDADGGSFDVSTLYFVPEYGEEYAFALSFEDGSYRVLSPNADGITQNDHRNTNDCIPRGVLLQDGRENEVCIVVDNGGVSFYYNDAAQELAAYIAFPAEIKDAAAAFDICDLADIDGDGNSDPTLHFTFSDGSDACLLFFSNGDGTYYYNTEFSWLPGETSPKGD